MVYYAAAPPGRYGRPIPLERLTHPPDPQDSRPPMRRRPSTPHRRRCADLCTMLLVVMIWGFLVIACLVLLMVNHLEKDRTAFGEVYVLADGIAATIFLASAFILPATILNEVLIERCWLRVQQLALDSNRYGKELWEHTGEEMARHLRAANLSLWAVIKRFFTCKLSLRDLRTLLSYALLRWGTIVSIAGVQLCVSWKPADTPSDDNTSSYYVAHQRYIFIILPILAHAISIFGPMVLWLEGPHRLFSNDYDERGLWETYTHYLRKAPGGSLASTDDVAKFFETPGARLESLMKKCQTGRQVGTKLKGVSFGLLAMWVPPALAWAFTQYAAEMGELYFTEGVYRFVFHLVFLAQNVFYLLALDFVIWNLSLESFCALEHGQPLKKFRHLGHSSGTMLFFEASRHLFRDPRPARATFFLWAFWLQASAMRLLSVVYVGCVEVLSYGSFNQRADFYQPEFWIGWTAITFALTVPLFGLWLVKKFAAPMCEQNGWRWAKIADGAFSVDQTDGHADSHAGFYGVQQAVRQCMHHGVWQDVWQGHAVWAADAEPFTRYSGRMLM